MNYRKHVLFAIILWAIIITLMLTLQSPMTRIQNNWWDGCPGPPICPTPYPVQPTYTPRPTPTCLPTPVCPPNPSPTPYPTATAYPPQPTFSPVGPPPTTEQVYHVSTDGSDTNSGTEAHPFRTIQHAANLTQPGDTVIIRGGTYKPFWIKYPGAENQPITFKNYPGERPVIDGTLGSGVGINLRHHDGPRVPIGWIIIDGLEVFRANPAGIKGYRMHHIIIRNCSIHHSVKENLLVSGSHHVTIEKNRFYQAHDHDIYASGQYWTVANNIFFGTTTRIMQLYPYTHDRPDEFRHLKHWKIFNNVFAFNKYQTGLCLSSYHVGDIEGETRDIEIYNNIFYGNAGSAVNLSNAHPNIKDVRIHDNIHYGNARFIGGGTHPMTEYEEYDNHHVEPLFVYTDQSVFSNNDFHLQSGSPAIDAGVEPRDVEGNLVTIDFDDNPRPHGAGYDIGAYEYGERTPTLQPQVYHVATTGDDTNPGTEAQPFRTIQHAASLTQPGDTVLVEDGTYTRDNWFIVNLDTAGTADTWITFRSKNKWGAIIDGRNNASYYCWRLGPNARYVRVEDFEVTDCEESGFNSHSGARHIYLYGNHVHHIGRLCTDSDYGRVGAFQGGESSYHTYDSNVFHDIGRFANGENGCQNDTNYYENHDHGIYVGASNATIINNIFYNLKRGWPIHIYGPDQQKDNIKIINNTFAFANPWKDGQIVIHDGTSNVLIQNNIFYQARTAGISSWCDPTNVTITNNLSTNDIVTHECDYVITGNLIDANPMLVDPDNNNFHLQPSSPATDAGTNHNAPNHDFDGLPRPQGTGYDIGAYEYTN